MTTVTTASASGSASGNHTYSSSGTADSWSQTGDYAAGNGTSSETSASSGVSLTESLQSQWQENYVISAGPTGTTTTGGASGSSQASGDASWYEGDSGSAESESSGYGYSDASGTSWASGVSGQDHYDDQSSWSEPWNLVGTSSGSSSSGTTVDHVWGDATLTWSSGGWSSQSYGSGSGSGHGSGSSTSFSTSGSTSSSYDQDVGYTGFYQNAGFSNLAPGADGGWRWGVGWGGVPTGPLGPSAYSGLGYAFAPGDAASIAPIQDQSDAEGEAVSLQVPASDASAGSGSGSGPTYTADLLPPGLSIDATTGLISGTIAAGAYAQGPFYLTTVAFTDPAGDSASQTFMWLISDPVTLTSPGDQSSMEGQGVTLTPAATDVNPGNAGFIWSAQGLPAGLVLDTATGVISGAPAAGSADGYPVMLIATDATVASDSQLFYWNVADPVTLGDPGAQSTSEGAAVRCKCGARTPTAPR